MQQDATVSSLTPFTSVPALCPLFPFPQCRAAKWCPLLGDCISFCFHAVTKENMALTEVYSLLRYSANSDHMNSMACHDFMTMCLCYTVCKVRCGCCKLNPILRSDALTHIFSNSLFNKKKVGFSCCKKPPTTEKWCLYS